MTGRLVHLELDNFKSYHGKQIIGPFDDNFVSVIGPNGAGKSNLMDALSFVLGLHSGQLRSQQLIDLIYRRSSDEKVSNHASVTVVYKRADGNTLNFSRRINPSGSSEYRIGGRLVSYGDYVKVWENENVLIKARNFLVFQGDVDAIASKSPKELTKLFEQISGSEEFKEEYDRCKVLYERALEESSMNFNKKRGLGGELKQVQDQREDVLRYEKLHDDRIALLSEYYLWKLFHVEESSRKIGTFIERKEDELKEAEKTVRQAEAAWKESKKTLGKAQKDILAMEKKMRIAQKEVGDKAPQALCLEETAKFTQRKLETLLEGENRTKEDLNLQQNEIKAAEKELADIETAFETFEKTAIVKLNAANVDPELLDEYNDLKEKVSEKVAKERLKLESLQKKLVPDFSQRAQIEGKLEELATATDRIAYERGEVERKHCEASENNQNLTVQIDQLQQEIISSQANRLKLEQTKAEVTERLRDIMGRLVDAKVDQRESEREVRLGTTIESLKRIFSGVHGRMIDLCRPIGRKYDYAITIGLGRNIDSVVVDQERTAIACIQYLREQRIAGQITFIPLDTIQSSKSSVLNQKSLKVNGCRPLVNVLKFDNIYENAFQYATGGAVVCDTLDIAKDICFNQNIRVKVITLDGTIIHKSGLMTGGITSNQPGRRWEAKELQKLKEERDSCLSIITDTSKQLKRTESDERMRAKLIELEARKRFIEEEIVTCRRKLDSIADETLHIDQERARCIDQLEQIKRILGKHEKDINQWKDAINKAEDQMFTAFCSKIQFANIREFETSRLTVHQEIAEKRVQFSSIQSKLVSQIAFYRQQIEGALKRLEEFEQKRQEHAKELDATKEAQNMLFAGIEKKRQILADSKGNLEEIKRKTLKVEELVDEKRSILTMAQSALTVIAKEISTSECEIERLLGSRKVLLRTCKMEEVSLPMARPGQSFNDVDIDVDQSINPIVFDFSSLSKTSTRNTEQTATYERKYQDKLKEFQDEMDKLVPNLRALDKLEGAENRLKSTMELFEKAKGELKKAKDDYFDVKKRRFDRLNTAFKKISTNIDSIYKELTRSDLVPTGGTAFLSLENGDEPYLEGIRFHAMPPMKRFLDIDQLSGGERTVAALALLFSIHSFRPAPFFILDEIDSALDSANVMKVASFIKARSSGIPLPSITATGTTNIGSSSQVDNSPSSQQNNTSNATTPVQFLVISLKNSLYARADALVGIYRDPDERSSKVLTLKLSEYPE